MHPQCRRCAQKSPAVAGQNSEVRPAEGQPHLSAYLIWPDTRADRIGPEKSRIGWRRTGEASRSPPLDFKPLEKWDVSGSFGVLAPYALSPATPMPTAMSTNAAADRAVHRPSLRASAMTTIVASDVTAAVLSVLHTLKLGLVVSIRIRSRIFESIHYAAPDGRHSGDCCCGPHNAHYECRAGQAKQACQKHPTFHLFLQNMSLRDRNRKELNLFRGTWT